MKKFKKIFKRSHRRAKKRVKFLAGHPLLIPTTTFFVVVFFGLGMFVTVNASTVGASDTHIVDVYVDGERRTVSTRADTVEDLLNRLEVQLIPEDMVEPLRDTPIIEDNTQVNVYRARPVEIIDNGRIISLLSAQRAPRLLAAEAGLDLHPEDTVEQHVKQTGTVVTELSDQIVVDRSVPIQLNAFGAISEIRTTADTVEELLTLSGISLSDGETVQPADLSTPITADMLVSVNLAGVKTDFITEEIPYKSSTVTDANLDTGKTEIRTIGTPGIRSVVYLISEENGVEVSRSVLQTIVLRQSVDEVRIRGTKSVTLSPSISVSDDKAALMAAAGIPASDYAYVDFIISHESGWRPGARNSSSGAYGLCQSLPASKMASAGADYLTNPVTQLRWCSGYSSRYGGWAGSYNAWLAQRWW